MGAYVNNANQIRSWPWLKGWAQVARTLDQWVWHGKKKGQNSLSSEIWVKEVSLRRLKYFACNCGLKIRMLTIWWVHMIHKTKTLHKNIRIWC